MTGAREVLIAAHTVPGVALLAVPYDRLVALPGTEPLRALPPRVVTAVGAAQAAGVAALLTGRPRVRGAAALGFVALQVAAAATHARVGGRTTIPVNAVLAGAGIAVALAELRG